MKQELEGVSVHEQRRDLALARPMKCKGREGGVRAREKREGGVRGKGKGDEGGEGVREQRGGGGGKGAHLAGPIVRAAVLPAGEFLSPRNNRAVTVRRGREPFMSYNVMTSIPRHAMT